ncbi:hypothetical protein L195_g041211 [Trifolium pratense]|uniref:Copia protein n=1 Tax=Trifolium pratense TaxID=57577 RepID=A0A2K3M2W6_TRIPR|nr:hypothetical protein L195_g041211 [Trifolium pratense]
MNGCNSFSNPSETNSKLDECSNEEKVDSTMFRQMVGLLRYACNSRPDICYSVSVINKFMHDLRKPHVIAAKRILSISKTLWIMACFFLMCGDITDRRSMSGYVFKFNNAAISWCTKKQPVTALSSCEAEYIEGTFTTCQAMWLNSVMKELKCEPVKPLILRIDNKFALLRIQYSMAEASTLILRIGC